MNDLNFREYLEVGVDFFKELGSMHSRCRNNMIKFEETNKKIQGIAKILITQDFNVCEKQLSEIKNEIKELKISHEILKQYNMKIFFMTGSYIVLDLLVSVLNTKLRGNLCHDENGYPIENCEHLKLSWTDIMLSTVYFGSIGTTIYSRMLCSISFKYLINKETEDFVGVLSSIFDRKENYNRNFFDLLKKPMLDMFDKVFPASSSYEKQEFINGIDLQIKNRFRNQS